MGSGFEVYTQSTCNGKRRKRINAGRQHDAEKMEWHCHGFAVSRPRCGARVKDRYWHADGKYTLLMPSWDNADKSLSLAFPHVVTLPRYQSADAACVSPSVFMSVSNRPPPHIGGTDSAPFSCQASHTAPIPQDDKHSQNDEPPHPSGKYLPLKHLPMFERDHKINCNSRLNYRIRDSGLETYP